MNSTEAIGIIDAVMGDNWQGLEEPSEEDVVRAAITLHDSGLTGSLPGRYGRTVRDIFEAVLGGDMECPDDVQIERRS